MTVLRVMASRHSAFYSPLLGAIAGGFLIAARRPDPAFSWDKLLSGEFMFVHGGQPQAPLAHAMHKQGLDLTQVRAVNAGASETMMAAWCQGQSDYFHEQGPYPQQLEQEQAAHIVASVGKVFGPVMFSSLTATREWLQRPEAKRFMRVCYWVRIGRAESSAPGLWDSQPS